YVPNEHYWRGKPNLDKITMEVIGTNSVSQAIKSHKFDITGVLNSQWNNVKDTKGVNFIGKIPLSYNYLGFKVGKFDKKTGKNVEDKNAKMNNVSL
ncbi:ABC transporter substrate-binding protein, partial [Gardnerella swidsinskii]|nr:ABC transporter substrate-binding protein [Gardnerella swidsinskii]